MGSIHNQKKKNTICGIIYRQHNSPNEFLSYIEESFEKYSARQKPVFVLGDFNIDLLKAETCNFSHEFLLCLQSFHFLPTIDKPTRVHNNSATLIDNIFTNNCENSILSGNVISDISDHYTQFCIISSPQEKLIKKKKMIRDFSKFSQDQFLVELSNIELIPHKQDTDNMFSHFFKNYNSLINKHAPYRRPNKTRIRSITKPWITYGLRTSIKKKNQFLEQADHVNYKTYRNKIANLTKLSKKMYFHSYFQTNINNINKTGQGINMLISNSKRKRKSITSLRDPSTNTCVYKENKIADILNKHFSSVGQNLANDIPDLDVDFNDYLCDIDICNSFYFTPVTQDEIENEIMLTPANKSYGLYSCPINLLKLSKHLVSAPLALIFNTSIETGIFPSKLKTSKITPIYKADDETDPNNYRPISILSVFNRIFEKLMYKRLISFIECNNILSKSQYGFRTGHSTIHAILDIVNTIQENMDRKQYSCAVFIDLKKAFDSVNHSILIKKLEYYGIRGRINDWFKSYLMGRTQTTEIDGFISPKEINPFGVPQGSVIGPLLFLLYINDISNISSILNFFLFADDTTLLFAHKSLKTLEQTMNNELGKLNNWLIANKLTLNIKKSNFVIFRPYQKKVTSNVNIHVFDNSKQTFVSLENKDYVKYLGLLIDSNLAWKQHINYISTKISRSIGLIAKLRHYVPQNTLITLYWALIHPYLNYGIAIWGHTSKTLFDKLLRLQKRTLRLIFFKDRKQSAIPLFVKTNIPPLNNMYISSISNLMHDVNNKVAPQNLSKLFTKVSDVHHYSTRSSTSDNLFSKPSRLNIQSNSFSRFGVRLWNSIPKSIRKLPKKQFQKIIKLNLFDLLEKGNDYVDVSSTIQALSHMAITS